MRKVLLDRRGTGEICEKICEKIGEEDAKARGELLCIEYQVLHKICKGA
jgi:hypothetical protein